MSQNTEVFFLKNEINKRKKSYTLRKVEDNLSGMIGFYYSKVRKKKPPFKVASPDIKNQNLKRQI